MSAVEDRDLTSVSPVGPAQTCHCVRTPPGSVSHRPAVVLRLVPMLDGAMG